MDRTHTHIDQVRSRIAGRRTRWTVIWADRGARALITVGGIGTVAAVLAVAAFLIWVAAPLFLPARVLDQRTVTIAAADSSQRTSSAAFVRMACDDYGRLAWILRADGELVLLRLDDGSLIEIRSLFEDQTLTAVAFTDDGEGAAFGFADGTVRLGSIRFASQFLEPGESEAGEEAAGLVESTSAGQFRRLSVDVQIEDAIPVTEGSAVIGLDVISTRTGSTFIALSEDGRLLMETVRSRRNLMTGKTTWAKTETALPFALSDRGMPQFVRLSGLGDGVYLAWSDGSLIRYDVRDLARPRVAEEVDLVPEPGGTLTQLQFLLGRTTLVAGDAMGVVRTWFAVKPQTVQHDGEERLVVPRDVAPWFRPGSHVPVTSDRAILVPVVEFDGHGSAVASLTRSLRQRMLAVGYADGSARIVHVTSRKELATLKAPGSSGPRTEASLLVAFAPRDDALLAMSGDSLTRWGFDARHPETSLGALLGKVWYEGHEAPEHVWQSSSGTDDFESKYGLSPLLFGTIKATVYSMLFGVPIALLAAIYTSEFLHPTTRARVKPVIEMMASLPSVVLGFIAALVVAPFIEHVVPAVLLAIVTIPLGLLIGAYLWQMLPPRITVRFAPYRLWLAALLAPVSIGAAAAGGPMIERLLFAGDIRLWLDGQIGSGASGWLFPLLPLSAICVWLLLVGLINPWLRPTARQWSRQGVATLELVKFIAACVVTFVLAWAISQLLTAAGFDPRGSFLDTYDQRNALVVGFIMGFAIIPIIYTIADDALQAVPEHLRAASLGAGATPWQTAVRIIIPTAMSGLFSAVMIGLGRAVGETMIVLMAAGNTPVMDWNIFNGFRTLSANIAVELPEAVRNSTHYRTLFLAALVLFAMTFAVNTAAEIVRQRFRRRAWQL